MVKEPFLIIFHVMIWSDPIETTVKKWVFQVPGYGL